MIAQLEYQKRNRNIKIIYFYFLIYRVLLKLKTGNLLTLFYVSISNALLIPTTHKYIKGK